MPISLKSVNKLKCSNKIHLKNFEHTSTQETDGDISHAE